MKRFFNGKGLIVGLCVVLLSIALPLYYSTQTITYFTRADGLYFSANRYFIYVQSPFNHGMVQLRCDEEQYSTVLSNRDAYFRIEYRSSKWFSERGKVLAMNLDEDLTNGELQTILK